jgi:16S rRNA (cytidine1402-2'-O)-methyltransferase
LKTLTLLGLPLGNAQDISLRALDHLKKTNTLICEDTRSLVKLSQHLGIDVGEKNLVSFHDQSSVNDFKKVVNILATRDATLVSDAGSPLVSDPAYPLIREALKLGIKIDSIPGPSAPIVALELSGLAPTPFHFHGFIGRDKGSRSKYFDQIAGQTGTHIFFEGVSRVDAFLIDLCNRFQNIEVVVARELTKLYQSVYRFNSNQLDEILPSINFKGEFVILCQLKADQLESSSELVELAQTVYDNKAKTKDLSRLLASILKLNQKEVYQYLISK